jgi:hypothetical protein
MSKNQEIAKLASDLARAQDEIRRYNEELIKLSQRFGRMMPRLQKLETPAILSWLGHYNQLKDSARKLDQEMEPLLNGGQMAGNPMLDSQAGYYCSQRARLGSKMEVLDDVLAGMIEDLLENSALEGQQKEEMRTVLNHAMQHTSARETDPVPA